MINQLLTIILMVATAAVACEECLYFLHMFQLNGYKPNEYRTWIGKNRYKYLGKEFPLILALLAGITYIWGLQVLAVLFMACALKTNRIRKSKKPLAYTKRVVRLLITLGLLDVIVLALVLFLLPLRFAYGIYTVLVMLMPGTIMLANLINRPVEQAINRYYLNDAKRILAYNNDMITIGVTGSYGKTSVKNFLKTILSAKYNVLMTPHNYNTPMGIIKTVREELKPIHEVFICEMGARYVNDIKEDCDIAKPDMGIITSIGYQHLETFESIDNIIKTKYELAQALKPESSLFVNIDNEFIADNIEKWASHCETTTYGIEKETAQFRPYDIQLSQNGTSFKMRFDQEEATFTTKLIGNHNILNVAGVIAVAYKMNVPVGMIQMQVRKLEPVEHRLQIVSATPGRILIDDAYNSNPMGAKQALDALSLFEGMKIIVTPGMVELGAREYELNKIFAIQATEVCDRIVVVGRKRAEPFEDGVREAGYDLQHFHVAASLTEAMAYVNNIQSIERKVILLENDLPDNY